jgi:hypothetical protein
MFDCDNKNLAAVPNPKLSPKNITGGGKKQANAEPDSLL